MKRSTRFAERYAMFISDASNEEVVSVSKELSEELVRKIGHNTAYSIVLASISVAVTLVSVVLMLSIGSPEAYRAPFMFVRLGAIALMCFGGVTAYLAFRRFQDADSISTLMWRNIRENADDEKVYEQRTAIYRAGKNVSVGMGNLSTAFGMDVIGITVIFVTFVLQLFIENGFL